MIWKFVFVYLVGFIIFAILNTFALRWGGENIEDAKIKGAAVALLWFLELPQLIIEWFKKGGIKK